MTNVVNIVMTKETSFNFALDYDEELDCSIVSEVEAGGVAANAGLKTGDVLIKIGGTNTVDSQGQNLNHEGIIEKMINSGNTVEISVINKDHYRSYVESLTEVPTVEIQSATTEIVSKAPSEISTIVHSEKNTRTVSMYRRSDDGYGFVARYNDGRIVVEEIDDDSAAWSSGLLIGDRIIGFEDFDNFINHVRSSESISLEVEHLENYVPIRSRAASIMSLVENKQSKNDLEPLNELKPAVSMQSLYSQAPSHAALPISRGHSRANSILSFSDKPKLAARLGSEAAETAVQFRSETSSIPTDDIIEQAFAEIRNEQKNDSYADFTTIVPTKTDGPRPMLLFPVNDIRSEDLDNRSILDFSLDKEEVQIPRLRTLKDIWEQKTANKDVNGNIVKVKRSFKIVPQKSKLGAISENVIEKESATLKSFKILDNK